jgi:hypothetical protein
MELIEWIFTILSFVAYYFFIGKKASEPSFRLKGLLISDVIAILVSYFSFSIGVYSLAIMNLISVFFNGYGIRNCYLEMKSSRKSDVQNEI